MSVFAAAFDANLRGDSVALGVGALFHFASGDQALWAGFGPLDATAFGGPVFQGVGAMGKVSTVEIGPGAPSQAVTFELSGLDARTAAAAKIEASEVKGRRVELYFLLFEAAGGALLAAERRRTLIMDRMSPSIRATPTGREYRISLSAESILARKHRPPYAMLSDADQKGRHPGDRALEFTQSMTGGAPLIWN